MKLKQIDYFDRKYPVTLDLNVTQAIQKKYGSLDRWGEIMDAEETPIEDVVWLYHEMINEGIEIENDLKGEDRSPIDFKTAARIISFMGEEESGNTLQELLEEGVIDEEEEGKNE